MNDRAYRTAMSKMKASDQFRTRLIKSLSEKTNERKRTYKRRYFVAAAACLAVACVVTGALALKNSMDASGSKGNTENTFGTVTVNLSLGSSGTAGSSISLPANALNGISGMVDIPIPSDGHDPFSYSKNNGTQVVDGFLCLDITVDGAGVEKVIFESKNYIMSYEDSRNWMSDEGALIWSEFSVFIPEGKIDIDRLSKESIVSALVQILSSTDDKSVDISKKIFDRIYVKEFCEELDNGGTLESFYERMKDTQIDFSQYNINYSVYDNMDNNKGLTPQPVGQREVVVTISNPQYQYIPKVWSKKIETRNGETVVWGLDDKTCKQIFGKKRAEADYSLYSDEITITIIDQNGSSRSQTWEISCDDDRNVVITEVSASNINA